MAHSIDIYSFFERPFPSANAILLHGPAPVLVDPGFGSDVDALDGWLRNLGINPGSLSLIVNTHYHSDHVGGNHRLQSDFQLEIAAHKHEAHLVNARDPNACAAVWLRQPVESYVVNRLLQDGDLIDTGRAVWQVLHTPGHTVGHIALYESTAGILIAGDTVHANDIGWLNPTLEGHDSIMRSLDSVTRIEALQPSVSLSGHGPATTDPSQAFAVARRRLERWQSEPEAAAWHASKRILAFALMIEGGIPRNSLFEYLAAAPWVNSFASAPFAMEPEAFANTLVNEMLRSGGITWRDDRLVATAEHTLTTPSWPKSETVPALW